MLFFFGGLFLMASLGMQRSHAVVLFSTLCPVGQGFFSFQKGFSLPRISLHFLDTPQIYASVAERSHGSRQAGICWNGPLPS